MVEIVQGKAKPRIVSWFTWSLLTAIACAASFADGQVAGGVLLLAATIETFLVVVLGLKYGDRKFERFDIVCQIGALVGLVLWLVFNSPAIAIVATVTIDCIGMLPTIKHSWQKPHEETWITFFMAGLASIFTLVAANNWSITAAAYPMYIVVANLLLVAIIFASPHRHKKTAPKELRHL